MAHTFARVNYVIAYYNFQESTHGQIPCFLWVANYLVHLTEDLLSFFLMQHHSVMALGASPLLIELHNATSSDYLTSINSAVDIFLIPYTTLQIQ